MVLDQPPPRDFAAEKTAQKASENYSAALDHRATLARLAEQSQSDYDKAVMTLSGGALGVSFGYMKDVAGSPPYAYWGILLVAWTTWTFSVTACLFSLAFSGGALRREIDKIDGELLQEASHASEEQKSGGGRAWDKVTGVLNWAGGVLFAVGAVSMIAFVIINQYAKPPTTTPPTAATGTPNSAPQSGGGPTSSAQHGPTSASPSAKPTSPVTSP